MKDLKTLTDELTKSLASFSRIRQSNLAYFGLIEGNYTDYYLSADKLEKADKQKKRSKIL